MRILTPNKLTIEDALGIAKAAVMDTVGDESYEMARLYHEEGVAMTELAQRHQITRQAVCQRINATHVTLRRLSARCGISLMPKGWGQKGTPARGAKRCGHRDAGIFIHTPLKLVGGGGRL